MKKILDTIRRNWREMTHVSKLRRIVELQQAGEIDDAEAQRRLGILVKHFDKEKKEKAE